MIFIHIIIWQLIWEIQCSLELSHWRYSPPKKTHISILYELKIDGWSWWFIFWIEMLSFLGTNSYPLQVPSFCGIRLLLIPYKLMSDVVEQVPGPWTIVCLSLQREKDMKGDFWDLVFNYCFFCKSPFLMDKKNRWTAELWPELMAKRDGCGVFPRCRLFASPVLYYHRNPAKRNISAGDTRRTGGLQCQVSSTWPSAKRRTASNKSPWVGTRVTNWINQVSGWYSVLVSSDPIFLFHNVVGILTQTTVLFHRWGRKVYAQGMGSEAISRILHWVQTSTEVRVSRFGWWFRYPAITTWDVLKPRKQ